ncbi:NAD(P)/FAD-dependent oxidoreductase [Pseudobacillus wudalianchiensis]|uniref:Carotene 7,8-desaturase n=1 Tax=Pseudobacillus wudalianchiensis TaxID=1743143 RepID=A0A1B9ADN0_9BACI|nr:NAD(P)/FAD-dependent oxidoreductase [Bacillus wudalianchiensis]OCA81947.1 carotene 7,8-desaturase [Bacillus wudalianchiensis]
MKKFDVIIVGAGLAGLSCGLQLSSKGKKLLLLEREGVVGGRTSSYNLDGMDVESGFHRYIGYYTHLPRVLRKAGVELSEIFMWEEKIHVRVNDEKPLVLGMAPLFGMIKTIKGLVGNRRYLSLKDKLSLLPFFMNGLKDYVMSPHKLDQHSIKEYAAKYNVTNRAFHHLIVPLSSGVFFLPPERYSAYVFFGLLAPTIPKFYKMRVGAYLGGMTEVMCQPIADQIIKNGGSVRTHSNVESLVIEEGKVKGIRLEDGQVYRAQHTVLAVTLYTAKKLLKPVFENHPWFQPMFQLPLMPAVSFQIEMTKPAVPIDVTTFAPFTCLSSFAEQSRTTFQASKGRLSIILSPPEKFLDLDPQETLQFIIKDARKIGLDLESNILDYRQVNHEYDFHSLEPGFQALRPTQRTPVEGLILAGDYTRQPYFATMEGATLSGLKAASLIK